MFALVDATPKDERRGTRDESSIVNEKTVDGGRLKIKLQKSIMRGQQKTILIVDDDKITRETLKLSLEDDFHTLTAPGGVRALEILQNEQVDVVLSDLMMPGMNGIELLERLNALETRPPVIFITGQATVENAVAAMKQGAADFITKPVNVDRLVLLIEKTLENQRLKEENVLLRNKLRENYADTEIIGTSPAMRRIAALVDQVSRTTATVLIEGESGTGKELLANILHFNSPVAAGPLIKVNCSAFAEGVLESELFGHEKGAFTGAVATRKGRFELADHGTLFLDEVGDMPLSVQVKLLRFLQEKTFERVGGAKTFQVEVRIVSATNRKLDEMVRQGSFREDLYYRLRVVRIELPPLRERREDMAGLVESFLQRYAAVYGRPVREITAEAMGLIATHSWPGNIRELRNCIESAVVMATGDTIDAAALPDYLTGGPESPEAGGDEGLLQEVERKTILDVLKQVKGDKTRAARILGIGLRTLYRKLDKWNQPF